jgi:hypothetical protein
MLDTFKSGQIKLTQDNLSDLKLRVYGNVAVITDVAGTIAGKDANGQIACTRVYVKKGSTWQSVAYQQTLVSNQ